MGFSRQEYSSGLPLPTPTGCTCCCCCCVASVVSDSVRPHRWQPIRLPHPWDSPGKNTGVGCHFLLQCMKVKSESEVAQSCPTLLNPMDCSLPGSSIHGIFQARVLESVAISFSRGSSQPRDQTGVSCIVGRCFTVWATREQMLLKSGSAAHCSKPNTPETNVTYKILLCFQEQF